MDGFALVLLGFGLVTDPIQLPKDVVEMPTPSFALPLLFKPNGKHDIERISLFVSEDRGKTWKLAKDCKPTEKTVTFTASRDDLYWFAVQVVRKDGTREPAGEANLAPAMKVYVNTARKAVSVEKSYAELQQEVEVLRKTMERLQKRIKELESERKQK